MSGVLNDCDALLQAASVRVLNPKNAWIDLNLSAPGFHLTAAGVADLAVVTVTADLIGLDDAISFSAVGGTLSNATGNSVDVTYAGSTAIVTATVVSGGEEFKRSCVIPVLRDGAAGPAAYTWIKYADTAAGAGLSDDPAGKAYIGLAHNKPTATESTTPGDYTWAQMKGGDGLPGTKGADGITYYTWIKYADQADGTGLYDVPNANTLYIGIAVNRLGAAESTTKTDYVWSRFKGEQGVAGVPTYTWIKYADSAAGAGLADDPTGKTYIGFAYNKASATESTTPGDYTWSLIKGTDGQPGGTGATGATLYTWIKYSDVADGTGLYDLPTASTLYIGIATNKSTATESTVKTDYVWSKFKGDQGVQGPTTYTWVKYADSAAGGGLSDDPTGKTYIGFAYNKPTATESTTATDYAWSLIKGTDGQPGGKGADGQTLYTWIKYSDNADGTGLYDLPTASTQYLGIAVNKSTATESTVKTDYVWSKFRGADGVGTPGTAGARGAGHYYAAGGAWSDGVADAATPDGNVVGDVVTISSGTFVMEKRWTGSAWVDNGVVINGKLIVPDSILTSALAANVVTTEKLLVTSKGSCINDDPALEDMTAWRLAAGLTRVIDTFNTPGSACRNYITAPTYTGAPTQVYESARTYVIDPASTYRLSASLYAGAGNNRSMFIYIDFFDKDGVIIGNTGWGGARSGYVYGGAPPTNTFSRQGGQFGFKVPGRAIPFNARTARVGVWFQYTGDGAGSFGQSAQDLRLERATDAALMVDGDIEARHIKGDTLDVLAAKLGNVEIGAGGALRQGQTAYDTGTGVFLGAKADGNAAFSMATSSGAKLLCDPANGVLKLVNVGQDTDLGVSMSVVNLTNQPNGVYSYWDKGVTITGSSSGSFQYRYVLQLVEGDMVILGDPTASVVRLRARANNSVCEGYLTVTVTDEKQAQKSTTARIRFAFGSGALY